MINLEKHNERTMLPMLLVFVLIAGILAISFYYLYGAVSAYARGELEQTLYYVLLAAVGIGISFYITYMIRKRTISQKPVPKIITTIECKKCGFKNLRKFEKGDFIFKSNGNCQKCNEPMLITAIYAEEVKK